MWSRESSGSRHRRRGPRPEGRPGGRRSSPARSPPSARSGCPAALRPRGRAGACPSRLSARAPICRSGTATRSTGRRRSDASPVRTLRKGRPARTPASMRSVDPELPQSRSAPGARKPSKPRPSMRTAPFSRRTSTPSARRQREGRGVVGGGAEVRDAGCRPRQPPRRGPGDGTATCRREARSVRESSGFSRPARWLGQDNTGLP